MACRPIVNTNDKKSKKLKILSYPADSLKAPSGLKSVYARAFFFFLANQPTKSKPAESSSEIKIGRRSKSPVFRTFFAFRLIGKFIFSPAFQGN